MIKHVVISDVGMLFKFCCVHLSNLNCTGAKLEEGKASFHVAVAELGGHVPVYRECECPSAVVFD